MKTAREISMKKPRFYEQGLNKNWFFSLVIQGIFLDFLNFPRWTKQKSSRKIPFHGTCYPRHYLIYLGNTPDICDSVCRSRAQNYTCGKLAVLYSYSLYTVFHSVIFNSVSMFYFISSVFNIKINYTESNVF